MTHETTPFESVIRPGAPREASLVLIYGGPELGKRFALIDGATVGRDPGNLIRVDMSYVSRQHARFLLRETGWVVSDLGSTNGTRVNGVPATGEALLSNGDQIRIGGAIFKYLDGTDVEALFHEEIYRLTVFDGLTKVHNRRSFTDFVDRELARARRYGSPLALAMLDIDHFKKVNDVHGHQAGDAVLERVAAVLSRQVRREQLLARYGGEEFAIVLPELDAVQVKAFCESARKAVEDEVIEHDGKSIPVTVSVGVALLAGDMDRTELIRVADAQLYESKRGGRNRVSMAVA